MTDHTHKRRLGSRTIGSVLPDRAREDEPRLWGDLDAGEDADDARLLDELPPHHLGTDPRR